MNQDLSRPLAQEVTTGPRKRAAYSSPALAEYGQLSALTTGGVGSVAENMVGGPAMMKHP